MTDANVLVLGHGTRAFLSVIRSLGREGYRVHVAMCSPDDMALRSRFVHARHEVRTEHWLEDMVSVLRTYKFGLVLPCGDESMYPVQQHQSELRKYAPVYAYPEDTYKTAFSKYESALLAARLDVPVPRQMDITESTTADELVAGLGLPLVLKPPSSVSDEQLGRRLEVVRTRSKLELQAMLPEFVALGAGAVAQENFIGVGVGVELLAQDGEILVAFQHRRVHEPLEGGGSSYRRSECLNPGLLSAAAALMRSLSYTGVAMVEFKLNTDTGDWRFIEINGRFWGSLPLAISAGVDFPAYLLRMMAGQPIGYEGHYDEHVYSRSLLDDYHWFASNLRADHDDPTLATVPTAEVFLEFGNVLLGRERIDTWQWGDMAPARAELGLLFRRLRSKLSDVVKRKLTRKSVLINRANTLAKAFSSAQTVGFVCYGNICRSPFAEAYAAAACPSKTFWSSGFHEVEGRKVPMLGEEIARDSEIDLSACRSKLTDPHLLEPSDLVLVFDEKNLKNLTDKFPFISKKVFFLGDALAEAEREIADPYGGGEAEFRAAYDRIRNSIDVLLHDRRDGREAKKRTP